MSVLLTGDFFQLQPIFGNSLCDDAVRFLADEEPPKTTERLDGIHLFSKFKIFNLTEQMRAADDPQHTALIESCRRLDSTTPFTRSALSFYKCLGPADVASDPSWAFAPIVVTNNHERLVYNYHQAVRFAKIHGVPLIRWNHEFLHDIPVSDADLVAAREADPRLYGIFVKGAPGIVTENVTVRRGIANGTTVTFHSLTFPSGTPELDSKFQEVLTMIRLAAPGEIVTIPLRPLSINVAISSRTGAHIPTLIADIYRCTLPHCGRRSYFR